MPHCCSHNIKQNKSDVSSLSNFNRIVQRNFDVNFYINFDEEIFQGHVIGEFDVLDKSERRIILDTKKLIINKVTLLNQDMTENQDLSFVLHENHICKDTLGSPLEISLPETQSDKLFVKIEFQTTVGNDGIQWLKKEQTLSKKQPFLFTQGEPILSRTIFPCQDTPSVKVTFNKVKLTVEKGIVALFGGVFESKEEVSFKSKDCIVFTYHQKILIPTYLFSIAAGDLGYKKLSERCGIYAEFPILDAAAEEFSDTERFLQTAETYLDYPYIWGKYDILILPQAFPYGGMENPNLTFINSALIVGDKSMILTIAHEIAHSWTGNLVTNKDWNNFWMNEGFTVFLERKIIEILDGEEHSKLEAEVGYNELLYAIKAQGEDHKFTQLYSNFEDEDPDDAFSVVPYEKGFNLLYYLEKLIGKEDFREILRKYIKKFAYKSIEFKNFRDILEEELLEQRKISILSQIDWNSWVYKPGFLIKDVDFSTELSKKARNLYELISKTVITKEEGRITYNSFNPFAKIIFLNTFLNSISGLSRESFDLLKEITLLNDDYRHPELAYTWFQIAFQMKDYDSIPSACEYLKKQGRMKYIRPVLREFYKFDRERCRKFFDEHKGIFHIVPVRIIQCDFERIDSLTK